MSRNCCLAVLIILSSFWSPVFAAKDTKFIDFLAEKVFDVCQGNDIHLKDKLIRRKSSGEFITEIKWPYSSQALNDLFTFISRNEPFDSYVEGDRGRSAQGVGKDGAGFLSCKGHVLDINKYDYYWDKIKVQLPEQVFNQEVIQMSPGSSYKKTEGNQSPIIDGAHNQVDASKREFNINLCLRVVLGLSVALNLYLLLQAKFKRRRNSGDT